MKIISTLMAALMATALFTAPSYSQEVDLHNGEMKFKTLCVSCHGEKGHGDGIAGKDLLEKPSNIYSGLTSFFEFESELIATVLEGNEGMPAWGSILSETDVKDIFEYVRKINN